MRACNRITPADAVSIAAAAAHVPLAAVLCARALEAYPSLPPAQLVSSLTESATPGPDAQSADDRGRALERCFWAAFYFMTERAQRAARALAALVAPADRAAVAAVLDLRDEKASGHACAVLVPDVGFG
jgi:hypothetical protein